MVDWYHVMIVLVCKDSPVVMPGSLVKLNQLILAWQSKATKSRVFSFIADSLLHASWCWLCLSSKGFLLLCNPHLKISNG